MVSKWTDGQGIIRVSCILPELLDLLNLAREIVGECLLQGLHSSKSCQLDKSRSRSNLDDTTNLGLAGRVAAQTIEGNGLHDRLTGERGGSKNRSSDSQGRSHVESNNLY